RPGAGVGARQPGNDDQAWRFPADQRALAGYGSLKTGGLSANFSFGCTRRHGVRVRLCAAEVRRDSLARLRDLDLSSRAGLTLVSALPMMKNLGNPHAHRLS